jgi:heat shock protein HtpX
VAPLQDRLLEVRRGYASETLVLFLALTATLGITGWLLGGALGVVVAVGLAIVTAQTLASLGTEGIMRMQGAIPLSPVQAPELVQVLRALARRAALSAPPQLYLLPGQVPNAFAAGRGDDAAIAVSEGLLGALDRRELTGVLAHEVGHLQAGDTDVLRLAGSLVHATRTVGQVGLLACVLSALAGQPVPVLLPLLFFAAPSLGLGLQLWLSRRREFAADAAAVGLTGDAFGLASALARLDRWRSRLRYLGYALGAPPSWLSTHPPTRERLERLQQLQPEAFLPAVPRRALWHWSS